MKAMGNFEPLKIKHYLLVDVGGKRFTFDTSEIESIHTSKSALSDASIDDMKTAVRMHKKVIPIINLRQKFVLKRNPLQPYFPSLIFLKCKSHGETKIIGVQVDMIIEIVEINQLQLKIHKYGFSAIKIFNAATYETVPLILMRDIIEEEANTLLEAEVFN